MKSCTACYEELEDDVIVCPGCEEPQHVNHATVNIEGVSSNSKIMDPDDLEDLGPLDNTERLNDR